MELEPATIKVKKVLRGIVWVTFTVLAAYR
jgi:hypothetical protein